MGPEARLKTKALLGSWTICAGGLIPRVESSRAHNEQNKLGCRPSRGCVHRLRSILPIWFRGRKIRGGAKTSRDHSARREFYQALEGGTVRSTQGRSRDIVRNRLQPPCPGSVLSCAEGVVSAADADGIPPWLGDRALRWGLMGNMLIKSLGGGEGGHHRAFFRKQFTPSHDSWWKNLLGKPRADPESPKEAQRQRSCRSRSRPIDSLGAERAKCCSGLSSFVPETEKAVSDGRKECQSGLMISHLGDDK